VRTGEILSTGKLTVWMLDVLSIVSRFKEIEDLFSFVPRIMFVVNVVIEVDRS